MIIDLKFVSDGKPVPTGKRTFKYFNGRLWVQINSMFREVTVNLPPVGQNSQAYLKVTK